MEIANINYRKSFLITLWRGTSLVVQVVYKIDPASEQYNPLGVIYHLKPTLQAIYEFQYAATWYLSLLLGILLAKLVIRAHVVKGGLRDAA